MKRTVIVLTLVSLSIFSLDSRAWVTTKHFMDNNTTWTTDYEKYWTGLWKGIFWANAEMEKQFNGRKLFCMPPNLNSGNINAGNTITNFLEKRRDLVGDKYPAELMMVWAAMEMFPCN
jgi:hypothetical protein